MPLIIFFPLTLEEPDNHTVTTLEQSIMKLSNTATSFSLIILGALLACICTKTDKRFFNKDVSVVCMLLHSKLTLSCLEHFV